MGHLLKQLFGIVIALLLVSPAHAQDQIRVERMVFGTGVVDRQPVEPNTSFTDAPEEIFCFTQIEGADVPTTIDHVWSFQGEEKFRISLSIGGESWRTWSSRSTERLLSQGEGEWRVDVVAEDGQILESGEFSILPESQP